MSVKGGADVEVPDFKDPNFPLKIFTSKDVEAINLRLAKTRSDRVRAALFPETLDAGAPEPPSTQTDPRVSTAIQKLSQPAMELRDAIEDIINYQLDADFAAKFIPEIIKLLADKDNDVVRNAAELTSDLTISEAACTVATKSPQLVAALVKAANAAASDTKEDLQIKQAVAGSLLNLSKFEQGRLTIFKTGGIPILVKLLGAPAERVVNYSISTLHNLLAFQEGAKLAVRAAGGIQKMVPLLKGSKDQKFLAVDIDCLHMMAFSDVEAKLAIYNSKGPKELVAIFKGRNAEEKLVWTTIRLLKVLSTCPHNKEQIVESGGFEAIVARLDEKDPKIFYNYLTTLRNLSDAEANFRCDDSTVSYLLQFLKHNDEEVVVFVSGILANLSAKKPKIKQAIFRAGGIELLLHTLVDKKARDEVREPVLCCLRHLTSQHQMTSEAQLEFRQLGGLELGMQLLQLETEWPMVKAACGLVRNLVNCEENHQTVVDLKVIPRLGQILALAVKEEKNNAQKSLQAVPPRKTAPPVSSSSLSLSSSTATVVDGVDMSDIMESSLTTLALLASASMINRDSILELNIAPLVNRLKDDKDTPENVVTACKALMEELSLSVVTGRSTRLSMISRSSMNSMDLKRSSSTVGEVERSPSLDWRSQRSFPEEEREEQQEQQSEKFASADERSRQRQEFFSQSVTTQAGYSSSSRHIQGQDNNVQLRKEQAIYENMPPPAAFETVIAEIPKNNGGLRVTEEKKKDKKKKKEVKKDKKSMKVAEPQWLDSEV